MAFIVVLLLVGGIAAVAWMLNRQGPAPDPGWGTADVDDDGGGYGTGEQQGGYGAGPDDDGDSSGYDQSGWNFGLDLDSDAGTDQPEGQPDHSGADDDQNLDPDPLEEAEINRRLTPDLPHGNLGDDLTKIAQGPLSPSDEIPDDPTKIAQGPLSPSDEMPDDPSERARWIRARIRDRLVDEYVRRPGVSSGTPPPEVLDLGDDVPLETKRLAHEVWQEIRAKYWPSTTSTQPDPLGESVPVDPVDDPDYDG